MKITVTVNGTDYSRVVEPRLLLIHFLRDDLGLTAVGAEHFVAAEAEDFLRGQPATEENFKTAAQIAAEHCHPVPDQRGPEDYKRHLVAELTTRALRRAAGRAAERTTA